ncbi:MAG TPA: N-acetyl-gamma-glutamyl-phosphate reductase [Chthonomonadaceae bacterium]|nr:N-acetyl-gamma-glutamyl-phosphate reductase [Chthonomonadaceae bacterium]
MVQVAVVGASGYGGGELLRLLLKHPNVRLRLAVSETYAGKPLTASFPGLAKQSDLRFESYGDGSSVAQCDVVFLAQENGKALQTAPHLLEAGCKVVDLSADFRFRDVSVYGAWYSPHTAPQWNTKAVYGLPELHGEEIQAAQIVGNPGCYPTATLLALAPLLTKRLVDPSSIIVDAKSGVSGAGRSKFSLDYHYPEANESVSAYKIAGTHRHTPEIEQELTLLAGRETSLTFTPHLVPMTRGILATCYANLTEHLTSTTLLEMYAEFYADAPFVYIQDDGLPATKHTLGSNRCHIGLGVDVRNQRVVVVSAIDNLIKGMTGQAIQNMNLMCGFEETAGLMHEGGVWP